MYALKFKKSARDDLRGLPRKPQEQIASKLRILSAGTHAHALDIVPIKGRPGYHRLRSGSYRVIYYLDEDDPNELTILIIGIKHRRDAYA